jgi:hypothetical protein
MAEDAVCSEPLSGYSSLQTGNLTGKSELLPLLHAWRRIACCTMQGAWPPLPSIVAQKEQGIFSRVQGIEIPRCLIGAREILFRHDREKYLKFPLHE